MKNWIFYILTIFTSVLILVIGHFVFVNSTTVYNNEYDDYILTNYRARVIEIFSIEDEQFQISIDIYGQPIYADMRQIIFTANLTSTNDNRQILARQIITDIAEIPTRQVAEGDIVLLQLDSGLQVFELIGFVRIHYIIIFAVIIFALIIIFGRMQGFNSIVALALIIAAIFMVFIPAILSGANIYIAALLVCVYSIITTLLIVIGPTKKSISTMVGCLISVACTAVIVLIMDNILGLTGLVDSYAYSINVLILNDSSDLRAIIFAGIVIGSVGAIMDVCMSISSSLWEVSKTGGNNFNDLYKSGINIGKDILGTMANTLVLAYIGSSITITMLIITNFVNVLDIFHDEMIIQELLRSLVGIFGIFLAIPITTVVCAFLYTKKQVSGTTNA